MALGTVAEKKSRKLEKQTYDGHSTLRPAVEERCWLVQ